MIRFKKGMDAHSLSIMRETYGKDGDVVQNHIGYLQWHENRKPNIVLSQQFTSISISELKTVMNQCKSQGLVV